MTTTQPHGPDCCEVVNPDAVAYVDSIHQRSPHAHTHLRSTDECLHREDGERCPTWQERAELAEAIVARVRAKRAEYQRWLDVAIDPQNRAWLPAILGALDAMLEGPL